MKRVLLAPLLVFSLLNSTSSVFAATTTEDSPPQVCDSVFGKQTFLRGTLAGAALLAGAATLAPTDVAAQTSSLNITPEGKISFNVCGGGTNGTYTDIAQFLVRSLNGRTPFEAKARSTLATLDNIRSMQDNLQCAIGVAQIDGVELLKRDPSSAFSPPYIVAEPVLKEQLHTFCPRKEQIQTVKDIAAKKKPIVVESDLAGAWITLNNLLVVDKANYGGITIFPLTENAADLKEKAFATAKATNACVAYVAKAPDRFLLERMDLAKDWNLVDMNVGGIKNFTTADGKPMYEIVEYDDLGLEQIDYAKDYPDLRNLPKDPYLPFRKNDSGWSWLTGDFNPETVQVNGQIVMDDTWRRELFDRLRATNQAAFIDRFDKAIADVVLRKGDFKEVKALLDQVPVEPLRQ